VLTRRRTRNTAQRKAILCALRRFNGHPTAADVLAYVRRDGGYPNLSLATVYRALGVLAAQGDIIEMRGVDNVGRYDGGLLPHHHVVCRACGDMTDVPESLLPPDVLAALEAASGYVVAPGHPIQFLGLCPACAVPAQVAAPASSPDIPTASI